MIFLFVLKCLIIKFILYLQTSGVGPANYRIGTPTQYIYYWFNFDFVFYDFFSFLFGNWIFFASLCSASE